MSLKKKNNLQELKVKTKELENGWKRTAADFDNFRKRNEAQKLELVMLAKVDFMTKITPVLDNFKRAFEHISKKDNTHVIQGLKHIEKQLEDILTSEGLKRIPAEPGQKFDHNLHEAISCEPNSKIPCDHIIAEVESGWMFDNRVLKPAKVRVSKGK